jgi:hypothetical protein
MKRILGFILGLSMVISFAWSYPGGVPGSTKKTGTAGCGSCHGSTPTTSVVAAITGPLTLNPGQKAQYILTVSGGPGTGSGCTIAASTGTFEAVSTFLKVSAGELVQNASVGFTSGSIQFTFNYTAPATPGTATLYATGYSSNRSQASGVWNFSPDYIISITAPTIPPPTPVLVFPAEGAVDQLSNLGLKWNSAATASNYHIQISTSSDFSTFLINDSSRVDTLYQYANFSSTTKYYWRVRAKNAAGSSNWTASWNFTIKTFTPGTGPQQVGDFGSKATGNWGTDGSNWLVSSIPGTWEGATNAGAAPAQNDNVYIQKGHVITVEATGKKCRNLTIENGGQLNALTGSVRWVGIYGPSMINHGVTGDTLVNTDRLGIEPFGTCTISGTGKTKISRIRFGADTKQDSLIFATDVTVTHGASTSGPGLYPYGSLTSDSLTIIVNEGVKVTLVPNTFLSTRDNISTGGPASSTYIVNGTLEIQDGSISLRVAAGKTSSLIIGPNGVLNLYGSSGTARYFYPTMSGSPLSTVIVNTGGVMSIGGPFVTADFSNPAQVITGGGTFNLLAGSTMNITDTSGLGHIQTTTKNLSSIAVYQFNGTSAQITGNAFPANVKGLVVFNPAGLSLSKNLTIDTTLSLTKGQLITGPNVLALAQPAVAFRTDGYVVGSYKLIRMTGNQTFHVGSANGYAPLSISTSDTGDFTVKSVSGKHPNTSGNTLGMHWFLTAGSGISKADSIVFKYLDADITGLESGYVLGKMLTNWTYPSARIDTGANMVIVKNLTSFSSWAFGEPGSFVPTAVNNERILPNQYTLDQNFPNPFNPTTKIGFSLPVSGHVELKVFDLLGREVAVLVNEEYQSGSYAVDWNGANVPTGIYFYSIRMKNYSMVKKMILLR